MRVLRLMFPLSKNSALDALFDETWYQALKTNHPHALKMCELVKLSCSAVRFRADATEDEISNSLTGLTQNWFILCEIS